jgi:nucleoid-associated protein YgaU
MRDEVEKRRREEAESEAGNRDQAPQSTSTATEDPPYVPPEPSTPISSMEPAAESATASSDQGAISPTAVDDMAPVAPAQETYRVESGDTLSAIAQRFYGDAGAYMRIFDANRDKLDNPDMIHPGQELVIPR